MKAKMTVYQKGGKLPKKEVPAHLKSTTKSPAGTAPAKSGGSLYANKDGSLLRTYDNSSVAGRVSEKIDTTGYSKGKDKFPYEQVTEYATYKEDMPRFAVKKTLDRMNEGKSSKVDNRTGTIKKYASGGKMPIVPDPKKKLSAADQKFNANARSREAENLTEMRNALKPEGKAAVAKFDEELKAKGFKVIKKPVKKMAGGGKMNVDGYYEKGGKMPKYGKGGMMKYLKGGQVKLDKNKDGKITGLDFKMMK